MTVDATAEGAADITKEAAIKSIGKKANRYKVITWEKEGDETASTESSDLTYVVSMTGVT